MKKVVLIGAGILVLAAAIFVVLDTQVLAQDGGPWGGGGRRPGGGRMGMSRGGGSAMTVVGSHIFVLQGNMLYKIDPGSMKILKTLEIKPPRDEDKEDK